jgi:hypothetical protein
VAAGIHSAGDEAPRPNSAATLLVSITVDRVDAVPGYGGELRVSNDDPVMHARTGFEDREEPELPSPASRTTG